QRTTASTARSADPTNGRAGRGRGSRSRARPRSRSRPTRQSPIPETGASGAPDYRPIPAPPEEALGRGTLLVGRAPAGAVDAVAATRPGRSMSPREARDALLRRARTAALVTGIGLAGAGCHGEPRQSPGTPVALRSDGYTSSDACRACHPAQW